MATIRQKQALAKMVENGGIISKAMEDVGYSSNTAHTPQKLTESKGWKELMDEYLPDSLLVSKHNALLNKKEKLLRNNMSTKKVEVVDTGQIDTQAVSKGLDMAYKLKGSYEPDKHKFSFEGTTDEELAKMLTERITGVISDNGRIGETPEGEPVQDIHPE